MKILKLNKKEIELINKSCRFFMKILKEDSTLEDEKIIYDLNDILIKLK